MWESIVPNYFNVPLDSESIARMKEISGVYAKGGNTRTRDQEWEDDPASKKEELTKKQRMAAHKIMEPYYAQMEEFAKQW